MIEIYPHTITPTQSQSIINAFNNDSRRIPGQTGLGGVKKGEKDSLDLLCNFTYKDYDHPYNSILLPALRKCVDQYVEKFNFLKNYHPFNFYYGYNIQYYGEGQGYSRLHCEHRPERDNPLQDRMMAWMVYLNDAQCGTYFLNQDVTTKATLGDCVLWPAYWTHMHQGVTPNIGDKYIATGWLCFEDYPDDEEVRRKNDAL